MAFWNKEPKADDDKMLERVKGLEKRIAQLEQDCAPFRVGEDMRARFGNYWSDDHRPRVSLRQAAEKIMAHCGLSFDRIPPVAEQIVVNAEKRHK